MNLLDKLIPHLIWVAALVPTVLLVVAAAVSLSRPDASIAVPLAVEMAAACQPCRAPVPDPANR